MLIIFPPLLLTIDLAASFERRKTALSCVSMTLSQSSGVSFNTPPLRDTLPALFTRMPMPPSSLSTLFSAGSNAARLLTSTLTANDGTPIAFNSENTRWFFSSFRPNTATAAPASANPSAMLRPIPPLPPVTTATRPVKSNNAGVFIKRFPFQRPTNRIDAAKYSKSDRQREPSIGCQRGARDVASLVRAEEDDSLGDLVRAACAPRMNPWYQDLVVHFVAEEAARPVMH